MNTSYELQQDILKLFQGQKTTKLSQNEINKLLIYKGLVITNLESLLSKIFSEIHAFYKEEWREITKDYLERHPCDSPIYNKLCEKFPEFLDSSFFQEKYGSNNYFSELALYKWLDLKTYNEKEKPRLQNGFIQNYLVFESRFNLPLIIKLLKSDAEINKNDDMEEEKSHLFVYRTNNNTQTLVLNPTTREFIEKLETNQDLKTIKEFFIHKYSQETQNFETSLEAQIDELINYLKKMNILLI